MTSRAGKEAANHVVGRLSGVKATDTKVEAALKTIEVMRLAGMPTRKAEKMLADYRARTGE